MGLLALILMGLAVPPGGPCPARGNLLLVETASHELFLCEGGGVASTFSVRLASGGLGKTRQGDQKVPVGSYPLGAPRASDKFGVFIPIGYPTAQQKRRGYTGSGVGVHGPHRHVRWLGPLVNTFDTTDGCVGLASDGQMRTISAWVRRSRARTILIR